MASIKAEQDPCRLRLFLPAALFLVALCLSGQDSLEYPKGKIIEKLICRRAPDQSYALFLPSAYSAGESWPIIYAFDPGGQGRLAVEQFRAAAERFGYIIVGSNGARNGPWEPIFRAASAMWEDTHSRFNLDDSRLYSTGFSGGARAAALFSKMIGRRTAGVIGCGAGLAQGQKTGDLNTSAYCGIVGVMDGNFREMILLREAMTGASPPRRFLFFEGGHHWPPAEVCLHALEWMEIQAMGQTLEEKDPLMIEEAYRKEISLVRSWEEKNPWLALWACDEIIASYRGLLDTEKLRERRERLALSKAYKKALSREERIKAEEGQTLLSYNGIYRQIENRALRRKDYPQILRQLDLDGWKRTASGAGETDRRWMARRILFAFWFDCQHRGRRALDDGQTGPAVIFLRLAVEAGEAIPRSPLGLYYDLAAAYALEKNARAAVRYLRAAVEEGFHRFRILEEDEDFDPIRESREFKSLMQSVNKSIKRQDLERSLP
jgi:dienelactone hydrolase